MFTLAWVQDTLERAAATAVEAAINFIILNGLGILDITHAWKAIVGVGIMAGLTVLKAAVATLVGNSSSAGFVPDLPRLQVVTDPPVDAEAVPGGLLLPLRAAA